jgi:uncharacterized protein (DUF2235 family)
MKRIITCNDGTWNQPETVDKGAGVMTNVEKIYKCILPVDHKGLPQVKFYDQGVGTSVGWWNKIRGGVTGAGIDKNIKDTYKFIMWNYSDFSDELYLFGFSRGAYTARSIAGFIRNCGILKPQYLHLVDEAYELYRNRTILAHPDSDAMRSFRKQYAYNGDGITKITCIGAWDTVGALGIPLRFYQLSNKERYKFHDVTLSSWVQNAFHALAIHERRKIFSPTLWQSSKEFESHKNRLEQVWFAGVHANIGGGYQQSGLSDITLAWMMAKASDLGLAMNINCLIDDSAEHLPVILHPMVKGYMRNSIKDFWIYRLEPSAWRIMYYDRDKTNPAVVCKAADGKELPALNTNEKIHVAAWDRYKMNFDKKQSPYLKRTEFYFNLNKDISIKNDVDYQAEERQNAGDQLTKKENKSVMPKNY